MGGGPQGVKGARREWKSRGFLAPMAILLLLPDCLMTAAPHCTAFFNSSR